MSVNVLSQQVGSQARRSATRAIFFVTGMAMGLWAALVPYAQMRTHAEAGQLGLLLLCLGGGSLIAMLGSGRIIGLAGCRRVIVVSVVLYCLMLPLLATLADIRLLAASLFVFGMGIGLADVAMNVQGTLVEQAADKPLMSGFHCLWSVGGIAGAGGGALLLGAGISPQTTTFWAVALIVLVTACSFPALLTAGGEDPHQPPDTASRPNFRLVLMAIMAMICFMAEGAILDWSGIFMTQDRGMAVEHAGWGFAAFAVAMSLMRATGDAVVKTLGRQHVLIIGGILGIAGYLIVVLVPGWTMALCGFALVGIGAANIVPVLITLAGQEKVMPVHRSVALVATLGYLGVLGGPALIGWVAHLTNLYVAFALVAAAFMVIVLGAFKLKY
ncbi:MAG TPA: MFS transporter [Erwinia persicina]|uniref:MFS transporter n=1 Tax=Erwinia persicina TaxID=55211 RepID=UPI000E8B61C8|nr:MFS transporter [Erwinia persicina]MBD8169703.1 MFS transporter [Erwinia persicina]MCQ4107368.1 MFS transporter [Erwinia persicina]QZQ52494.1 MFS transporter [Erwinia persicina]UTX15265.1 MFS transporter [Erwinia persicina]HBQ78231.1 MFS transporter [Erwinia persicina]